MNNSRASLQQQHTALGSYEHKRTHLHSFPAPKISTFSAPPPPFPPPPSGPLSVTSQCPAQIGSPTHSHPPPPLHPYPLYHRIAVKVKDH
jgi:hypothetical protein